MAKGHSIIINMSNFMPFVFFFNPQEVDSEKKITYATTPNIGGAFKNKYFAGFDAKEVSFKIVCIDMESTYGVMPAMNYFEQLRSPDPGILGGWGMVYGNENYPPPKILFQFGQSIIPLVWDVMDVSIKEHHFHDGTRRGIIGIPKAIDIGIKLSLDEGHRLNKANMIAQKAGMIAGSVDSILREAYHKGLGTGGSNRKERTYKIPDMNLDRRY